MALKKSEITTITISKSHYRELEALGRKNQTFDEIVGDLLLLKSAKAGVKT
jgi:predicted CopG family antitoxin